VSVVEQLRAAGCVFAEDEARLLTAAAQTPEELAALVVQRVAGAPLEHILGWVEFCGLRLVVGPGVFVPRQRTQFLAQQAVALSRPRCVVLDLCCGCGAVGAAVRAAVPDADVHAADVDRTAAAYARRNIGAQVYVGDLYEALPPELRGRVDVLVVNAPYVPSEAIATMPPEARVHEPRVALDGGPDGLEVLRRVIAGAPDWLAPGAHLLVESSEGQAPAVVADMTRRALVAAVASDENATVVIGELVTRPA
jgi:release factor glutamine methyltransferase